MDALTEAALRVFLAQAKDMGARNDLDELTERVKTYVEPSCNQTPVEQWAEFKRLVGRFVMDYAPPDVRVSVYLHDDGDCMTLCADFDADQDDISIPPKPPAEYPWSEADFVTQWWGTPTDAEHPDFLAGWNEAADECGDGLRSGERERIRQELERRAAEERISEVRAEAKKRGISIPEVMVVDPDDEPADPIPAVPEIDHDETLLRAGRVAERLGKPVERKLRFHRMALDEREPLTHWPRPESSVGLHMQRMGRARRAGGPTLKVPTGAGKGEVDVQVASTMTVAGQRFGKTFNEEDANFEAVADAIRRSDSLTEQGKEALIEAGRREKDERALYRRLDDARQRGLGFLIASQHVKTALSLARLPQSSTLAVGLRCWNEGRAWELTPEELDLLLRYIARGHSE